MNIQKLHNKSWLLLVPASAEWVREHVTDRPLWSELALVEHEIWAETDTERLFQLICEKENRGDIFEGHTLAMRLTKETGDKRLLLFWLKEKESGQMNCYPYEGGRQLRGGDEADWSAFARLHTLGPPMYSKRKAKDPPQLTCAYVDGLPPPNFMDVLYTEMYNRFLEHAGKPEAYHDPGTPQVMYRHALELFFTPVGHPVLYSEPFNLLYFRHMLLNYFPYSDIYIFHRDLQTDRFSVIIEDKQHREKGSFVHPVNNPGDRVFENEAIPLHSEIWGEKLPRAILEKVNIPLYLLAYEPFPDTALDVEAGLGTKEF